MPSADDRCASCGCAPVPIVITSPIAEMPGTFVRNRSSTLMKPRSSVRPASAAPSPSVTGPRPVATSSFSIVSDSVLPVGVLHLDRHAAALDLRRRDLRRRLAPRCRACWNAFSSSADTASSSFGTRRGSSSITVTSLPKRRKIDANSTPTAPLPMIAIDFGTSARSNRLVARDDVLLVDLDAGHAARRRSGGDDDLARRERARVGAGDLDLALAGQARGALDPLDLVLLEQELDALGEAGDDLVLARVDARHVDRRLDVAPCRS